MKPRTMQREEFEKASAEECRQFFEVYGEISKRWNGPRQSRRGDSHATDYVAEAVEKERMRRFGKSLLSQIRDGKLVVLGMADTLRMPGLKPEAAE